MKYTKFIAVLFFTLLTAPTAPAFAQTDFFNIPLSALLNANRGSFQPQIISLGAIPSLQPAPAATRARPQRSRVSITQSIISHPAIRKWRSHPSPTLPASTIPKVSFAPEKLFRDIQSIFAGNVELSYGASVPIEHKVKFGGNPKAFVASVKMFLDAPVKLLQGISDAYYAAIFSKSPVAIVSTKVAVNNSVKGKVLGISKVALTVPTVPKTAAPQIINKTVINTIYPSPTVLNGLILKQINDLTAQGLLKGLKGDKGDPGAAAPYFLPLNITNASTPIKTNLSTSSLVSDQLTTPLINGVNINATNLVLSGPNLSVGGVTYSWPTAQGGASTVLTNDGTGKLTWTAAGSSSAAASSLTGTTLASNVVTSSLTAVGTIGTGVWNAGAVTSSGQVLGATVAAANTTNQLVLGTTNTITVTAPAPAASRTYTLPDNATASVNFVLAPTSTTTTQALFASATAGAPAFRALALTDLPAQTGTGNIVLATSPTLTTPNIGAASGTSLALTGAITGATNYNGLVITANTGVITTGTWNGTTIGSGFGGTSNAFFAVSGPAASTKTYTFPNQTDTVMTLGATQTNTAAKTFNSSTFILAGSSSGTITVNATATAGANTITIPAATGTLITSADTGTVTNTMLAGSIASSKLVGSDIATVGTITTGTWNAGSVTSQTTATSGTLFKVQASGSVTLAGALTQAVIDASTGYTPGTNNVTALTITSPAYAASIGSGASKGIVLTSGAVTENTGAATGLLSVTDITIPALTLTSGTSLIGHGVNITTGNITQSAGTLTENGINISTASSTITTGGAINGINITPPATATSTGTQTAINIGAITTVGAGMSGIKIGNNWNTSLSLAWPSATTAITNTSLDFGGAAGTQTLSGVVKFARSNTTAVCATATAQGIVFKNDAGTQVGHFCTDSANMSLWVATSNVTSTDVAENYSDINNNLEPGDVVALSLNGPTKSMIKAGRKLEGAILGIISTKPGVLLSDISESNGQTDLAHPKPVALVGRVPVKVTDENGPIKVGDYLTPSKTRHGYAMRATQAGLVLGRALENYPRTEDVTQPGTSPDKILVYANLSYYIPSVADLIQSNNENTDLTSLNMEDATAFGQIVVTDKAYFASGVTINGKLYASQLEVGSADHPAGITIYDRATKAPFCIVIENGAMKNLAGKCEDLPAVAGASIVAPTPTPTPAAANAPAPAPIVAPAPAPTPATSTEMPGLFALATGIARVQARLSLRPEGATRAAFDLIELHRGRIITSYDTEMTKKVHLLVISDDFAHFMHVHPAVQPNGHIVADLHVPAPGGYHLYADASPTGFGQQVFRFDAIFGRAARSAPALAPTPLAVHAGPYLVTLNSLVFVAGRSATLQIHLSKRGRPADDLHPYLGGAAHAVFISSRNLTYTHVHPMQAGRLNEHHSDMPDMNMAGMPAMAKDGMPDLPAGAHVKPDMLLPITLPSAGTYKLWLQFNGGDSLYVAPFVVRAD